MNPTLRTSTDLFNEAKKLVEKDSFPREAEAKFTSLMRLYDATRASNYRSEQLNLRRQEQDWIRERDPATLSFFAGKRIWDAASSEFGSRILSQQNGVINGRRQGAITELRDVSYSAGLESRTYTGLNVGTDTQGGFTAPIGFWPEVQFALRQVDGLFRAARWLITPTGNKTNIPTAFESNTGGRLAENAAIGQSNPTFGLVQFGNTPSWSSDQVLVSIQLAEDCGAPNIAEMMRQLFAIRISVGLGGDFIATLLSSAHTAATTASTSAITADEVVSLVTGPSNPAYAYKPTTGWLMNAGTLNYLRTLKNTNSVYFFPEKFDDDGDPLLEERKVYLCPNMPDIGAGSTPIAFGDLSRFWVRAVSDSFTVFRFDELYLPQHQFGYQSWWRAEGKLISADAGVSDFPIVLLQMHS